MTTVGWLAVTFATRPTDQRVLIDFVKQVRPPRAGWATVIEAERPASPAAPAQDQALNRQLSLAAAGTGMVYALLFATGKLLYGDLVAAALLALGAVALAAVLVVYLRQDESDT